MKTSTKLIIAGTTVQISPDRSDPFVTDGLSNSV